MQALRYVQELRRAPRQMSESEAKVLRTSVATSWYDLGLDAR